MVFDDSLGKEKIENRARYKQGGEHTRCDTEHKDNGKALYLFRSDPIKNCGGYEGGQVGV